MPNKLDVALAELRRAHDAVTAARAEFRRTLNAWSQEKSQANGDAHARAREALDRAIKNLDAAEQRRVAARGELFHLQGG